jgi:RHS repeat-associated protein
VNHAVFDHTYDNTTPPNGTTYAIRLNGSVNERIGLAKSLSVMPGDVLKLEVYAKYYEPPAGPAMGAFATLMAAILGNTASAGVVVDGSGYTTNFSTTVPGPGLAGKSLETGTPPKAYLNWLVFDRNYNLVESKSGYKRITTAAKEDSTNVPHERIAPNSDVVIDQAGYAYIYLSNENESPVEVYFDDFKVEHVKSPVISSQDYYPFGLTFNSYQRENALNNLYQFNGKEEQEELALDAYDYGARFYDPSYGRWWSADPMADLYHRHSPYNFSLNDPVNVLDPDGMQAVEWDRGEKSTFVGPNGKVIKHINDDDNRVYFVSDPGSWDGKSKDGLAVIGFEDPHKSYKPGDNYDYYNPREDPNFNGAYLIPAEAYNYNDDEDMQAKHDDDDSYIRNATHSDSYLFRLEKIIWRDLTAEENRETVIDAGYDVTRVGRAANKLGLHKQKKQSTGKLKGAKEQTHSKGIKRIRQKYNDKKRQNDNWHQNPNK